MTEPTRVTSVLDDVAHDLGPSGAGPRGDEPPAWLRWAAFAPASAVLALGSVGLLLAVNGWYRPALAFPLAAVVWLAVLAVARPALGTSRSVGATGSAPPRSAHVYAAVGVGAIVAITGWNMAYASTHVLIDRDGGSYANTARWIARDGSLSVHPRVGAFKGEASVGFNSLAVFEMPDGSLQFQFAHFLPVVLAEAHAVAGDPGLFHTPELLGGIALLAFFVLAWRLLRKPLFALSATLALGLMIPQVAFARDSYSEIPSQILLFTALWLLVSPRVLPRWRIALVSGVFLGMLEAARIDAIVFLIGVPVVCALAWLRCDPAERRRVARPSIVAFVAGLVPGMLLGLTDVLRHSGNYYSDLRSDVIGLSLATFASLVACAIAVALWRFVFPVLRRLPWNGLSTAVAVLVGAAGFLVWALRPRLQHVHGDATAIVGLQQSEHQTVDATRLYFERSMSWMAWYLGPLTLALAIIGAALLVRALLRGRMSRVSAALAVLVPGSLLYLYKAHAIPDHVWVTRRFLVSAFPTLVLLGLGMAAYMSSVQSARWGRVLRGAAVAIAIAAVAYPAYTVIGVGSMSEQSGYLSVVKDVCHDIGPHAALIVLEVQVTDQIDDWAPQAFRSWCGAEVGITRGGARADTLRRLAGEWKTDGRTLYVASSSADYVRKVLPGAQVVSTRTAVDTKLLAPTLTHRPDAYRTESFSVALAAVTPG